MGERHAPAAAAPAGGWRSRALPGLALLLLLLLTPAACSGGAGAGAPQAAPAATTLDLATPPPLQPEDVVDLTVYFRSGEGSDAQLEPVEEEVAVSDDLPRRALELLLDGPDAEHPTLEAPLPTSTELLDLAVEGGTAHVRLSGEVIADAGSVGASPGNEALALAALANTLTEFTSIERVVLEVEGHGPEETRAFWGGWGLPQVLVRDETVLADAEGEGTVDLSRFSGAPQQAGSPGVSAVRVTSIRVRDRITSTRLVLELADAVDPDTAAKVPPVRARRVPEGIALVLNDAAAVDGGQEQILEVDPEQFTEARSDHDAASSRLEVLLRPREPREYWLHTLSNPTRVVLDVKK